MNVVVTGSTGFIGSALMERLSFLGHAPTPLLRSGGGVPEKALCWDPAKGIVQKGLLSGADAVVHLAGESVASRRWNPEVKKAIHDSRVDGTKLLAEAVLSSDPKPKVVVCASAIGWYGDRGDERLNESSAAGKGFLSAVCKEWEAATAPIEAAGVRVVHLRMGMVLGKGGGALPRMRKVFLNGFGGRLGNGNQYMSWISLDDAVGAMVHALSDETLSGPVNAVAPYLVTNADFTKALAQMLKVNAPFVAPAFVLRLVYGAEMADEMLLASQRVVPEKLLRANFYFKHPTIQDALKSIFNADAKGKWA